MVAEVGVQEVCDAVDQANREMGARFDFEGAATRFEPIGSEIEIKLRARQGRELQQTLDILRQKRVKPKAGIACLGAW